MKKHLIILIFITKVFVVYGDQANLEIAKQKYDNQRYQESIKRQIDRI